MAQAAHGGVETASSEHSSGNYPASGANNGDRRGLNWGAGGGWNDATENSYSDSLEIAFAGSKTIDEIDVFTVHNRVWRRFTFTPVSTTKVRVLITSALDDYSRVTEVEAY